jgi:hypothetical protein
MTKKLLIIALGVLFPLCAAAQKRAVHAVAVRSATTAAGPNVSIVSTWQYTPLPLVPACPANGTPTACYNGFAGTVTLPDGSTQQWTVGSSTLTDTWTPAGGLEFGTFTVSVVTTGFDDQGNPIQSPPVIGTVVNHLTALNAPTNLTATVQP